MIENLVVQNKSVVKNVHILNQDIKKIIADSKLTTANNDFFKIAADTREISIFAAYSIAYNWREITKNFLFSTIKGIGLMAEKIGEPYEPDEEKISVLQTAFSIINDDLNSAHPTFKQVAPKGAKAAHYKWWQETILAPLETIMQKEGLNSTSFSEATQKLTQKMHDICLTPYGIAIQLRVVEAIAADICIAFSALFNLVKYANQLVFKESDKIWITSHIQAEEYHHQQVSSEMTGMLQIATTAKEQEQMLQLTHEYCHTWAAALNSFVHFLTISQK